MELQDGFIVGVFNYCDRWCERCALTSRCRVFAEEQRLSFEWQTGTRPWGAAEKAPATAAPVLRSLGAVAATFEEDHPVADDGSLAPAGPADLASCRPLSPEAAIVHECARDLGHRLWGWLAPESRAGEPAVKDAVEVLQHFAVFIGPKVYRALKGREDEDWKAADSDAHGSAKAALLACDRLGDAWLRLAEHGAISVTEAAPVLSSLQRLTADLERLFPRARWFVRPGFDEPEAVAMLEWRERG